MSSKTCSVVMYSMPLIFGLPVFLLHATRNHHISAMRNLLPIADRPERIACETVERAACDGDRHRFVVAFDLI